MFSPETYKERRQILRKRVGEGLILLLGNGESPMNYTDNTYRFRQDSTFLYYFGIQRPGLAAIIDVDDPEDVIFGKEYTIEDIVWMGAQESLREKAHQCGVKKVADGQTLRSRLRKAQNHGRPIHFLPPYRAANKIKLSHALYIEMEGVSKAHSLPLVQAVVAQREIKSKEEIDQLNRAVDVSVEMHTSAMKLARPGMAEAQIAAEVHRTALAAGGDISFPIIATVHGQTLHNHDHSNLIADGDLFLLDAGFENKMGYAGDLSSTFPVNQNFSSRQKDIYQITQDAHQAATNSLQVGVPFKDVHMAACRAIFDGLKLLGLTKGDTDEAVEMGVHALFFPCGTGHMMGLDVHDMEDLGEEHVGYDGDAKSTQFGLKSLRLAKPLQVSHVVTIEPGIYFIPQLIDHWQGENKFIDFINWPKVNDYRNFGGIRNEEDFVITHEGATPLGKPKPKSITEIEALRESAF